MNLAHAIAVEQRSPEWLALRVGLLTGSRAAPLLATLKSGAEPAARRDLRLALAVEWLTGRSAEDGYTSREMIRGSLVEPLAIAAYEAATGSLVERVGFIRHPELRAGCSPDGIVEDGDYAGIVEVKCPKSITHLGYLRELAIPAEHRAQVLHNVWITGAAFCDFVSYDDRFPAPLDLVIVRYVPIVRELQSYELLARSFLADVEREAAAIAQLKNGAAA